MWITKNRNRTKCDSHGDSCEKEEKTNSRGRPLKAAGGMMYTVCGRDNCSKAFALLPKI